MRRWVVFIVTHCAIIAAATEGGQRWMRGVREWIVIGRHPFIATSPARSNGRHTMIGNGITGRWPRHERVQWIIDSNG